MNKILLGYCIGAVLGISLMSYFSSKSIDKKDYQIQQCDSVNVHNQKVIYSLQEYIRLDSLTQLEQLYPKK